MLGSTVINQNDAESMKHRIHILNGNGLEELVAFHTKKISSPQRINIVSEPELFISYLAFEANT